MWRIIGITQEDCDIKQEQEKIISLIHNKEVEFIHIRKPSFDEKAMIDYLSFFPYDVREKLSLHSFHHLSKQMNIGGIHLNKNNPNVLNGLENKRISKSCHSIKEVIENKDNFNYCFLSPIFDSISKQGYKSNFDLKELKQLFLNNTLDNKVVALGGVTKERFSILKDIGFSSCAMLSGLWNK